jgi:hypothetical protein
VHPLLSGHFREPLLGGAPWQDLNCTGGLHSLARDFRDQAAGFGPFQTRGAKLTMSVHGQSRPRDRVNRGPNLPPQPNCIGSFAMAGLNAKPDLMS